MSLPENGGREGVKNDLGVCDFVRSSSVFGYGIS
jgi:hypothetical protein